MKQCRALNENGGAILWALVVMLMILTTGAVSTQLAWRSFQEARNTLLRSRAAWISRSGINRIGAELNQKPSQFLVIPAWSMDSTMPTGRIAVEAYGWGADIIVRSIGSVGIVSDTQIVALAQRTALPSEVCVLTRSNSYPLTLGGSSRVVGGVMSYGGAPMAGLFEGRGPSQSYVSSKSVPNREILPYGTKYLLEELRSARTELQGNQAAQRANGVNVGSYSGSVGNPLTTADEVGSTNKESSKGAWLNIAVIPGDFRFTAEEHGSIWEKYIVGGSVDMSGVDLERCCVVALGSVRIEGSRLFDVSIASGAGVTISGNSILQDVTIATFSSSDDAGTAGVRGIHFQPGVTFAGIVVSVTDDGSANSSAGNIVIDSGVVFSGACIASGSIMIQSDMKGSLDAKYIRYVHESTEYLNWLIDVTVGVAEKRQFEKRWSRK